jgi:hypothetical protein
VQTKSSTAQTEFAGASEAGTDEDTLSVNAMPNRQPPMSSTLLRFPKVPKALLLQHTGVGKLNMVATRKLSPTSGFALMTLNVV